MYINKKEEQFMGGQQKVLVAKMERLKKLIFSLAVRLGNSATDQCDDLGVHRADARVTNTEGNHDRSGAFGWCLHQMTHYARGVAFGRPCFTDTWEDTGLDSERLVGDSEVTLGAHLSGW